MTSSIPPSHHQDGAKKYNDDLRGGGSSSKKARRPPSETGFLSMGAWCEPRPARDEALVVDGYARGADGTSAWTPPATPYIGRLNTPPLSPMTYDTEFQPRRHEEQQEDSINENWYLARKSKMDMKCKRHFIPPPFSFFRSSSFRKLVLVNANPPPAPQFEESALLRSFSRLGELHSRWVIC